MNIIPIHRFNVAGDLNLEENQYIGQYGENGGWYTEYTFPSTEEAAEAAAAGD